MYPLHIYVSCLLHLHLAHIIVAYSRVVLFSPQVAAQRAEYAKFVAVAEAAEKARIAAKQE